MIASLKRAFRVAAAAAALLTLSPAQAIVYSGAWDPLFGAPFDSPPVLGWRGTVEVDVPESCVGIGDLLFLPTNSCGVPKVLGATVELYDNSAPVDPDAAVSTLEFDETSMRILGLDFTGSALDWIWTLPSNWLYSSYFDSWFSLAFLTPGVSSILALGIDELSPTYGGPVLLASEVDIGAIQINNIGDVVFKLFPAILLVEVSNVAENPPTFLNGGRLFGAGEVTDIPEPGSLALVALALVATGWVARTRRRR